MRKTLAPEIEKQRDRDNGGTPNDGPHGCFRLLCPVMNRRLLVIASDGREWGKTLEMPTDQELSSYPQEMQEKIRAVVKNRREVTFLGPPWEHVSVSHKLTVPTYYELSWIKEQFWEDSETVVFFFPAKTAHVNIHANCLHLWRMTDGTFPMPPVEAV